MSTVHYGQYPKDANCSYAFVLKDCDGHKFMTVVKSAVHLKERDLLSCQPKSKETIMHHAKPERSPQQRTDERQCDQYHDNDKNNDTTLQNHD